MARGPSVGRVITPTVVRGTDQVFADAAELVVAAYPVPALQMDAGFLRWVLGERDTGSVGQPIVVACRDAAGMVGFAGATPRWLALDDNTPSLVYIVSFVAVAERCRGRGVAGGLYDTLLPAVAEQSPHVVTFAVAGSGGARAIGRAYPRNGYTGSTLAPMSPMGALRGRVRDAPSAVHRGALNRGVLRLARTPGNDRHLDADPRGCRVVAGGARVVAAQRITSTGSEPLLALDVLPNPLNAQTLAAALRGAFDAFPAHGRQLVVPNATDVTDEIAAAAGLRRMGGPVYQGWIWTRSAETPLLGATATDHPIL